MSTATTSDLDTVVELCRLTSHFPAACYLTNSDGCIVAVSDIWLQRFGYAKSDVLGLYERALFSRKPAGDDAPQSAQVQRCAATCDMIHKTGDKIKVSVTTRDMPSGQGPANHQISIVEIIDADAELKDALLRKSFRLEACLEGTNAATWEWNVQTGEARFNARWADIVGYTLEELEPLTVDTWLSLVHPDDAKASDAALEKYWSGDAPFYDVEARMRHKDGHWVWVRVRGRAFTNTDDGKPEWMFGTHLAIDDERVQKEAFSQNERLLDRTGAVAKVGGWHMDLAAGDLYWTHETRRIHGVGDDYVPTVDAAIEFYAPEARAAIQSAVEKGISDGTPWDLELSLIRATKERIWVRAIGEVEFENEVPVHIYGTFQDITDQVLKSQALKTAQRWVEIATKEGEIGLWRVNVGDSTLTWSDHMGELFGAEGANSPKTLSDWTALFAVADQANFATQMSNAIAHKERFDLEADLTTTRGTRARLKLQGSPVVDRNGDVIDIVGACFEITNEHNLILEFERQRARIEVTLKAIADGVVVSDHNGLIDWMNPVAEALIGCKLSDVTGVPVRDVLQIIDEETGKPAANPLQQAMELGRVVGLEANAALLTKFGSVRAIANSASPIYSAEHELIGAVCVFRDIVEERAIARATEYRAKHDALTGLLNRDSLEQAIKDVLADPDDIERRHGAAVLFIDLDDFKSINDTYGHIVGDQVLKDVATSLDNTIRNSDAVGRIGGDEFVVLLNMVADQERLALTANRIVDAVHSVKYNGLSVGCSLGATFIRSHDTYDVVLRRADTAMYQAKKRQNNKVEIAS